MTLSTVAIILLLTSFVVGIVERRIERRKLLKAIEDLRESFNKIKKEIDLLNP